MRTSGRWANVQLLSLVLGVALFPGCTLRCLTDIHLCRSVLVLIDDRTVYTSLLAGTGRTSCGIFTDPWWIKIFCSFATPSSALVQGRWSR